MSFSSWVFIIFFAIVVFVYYILPEKFKKYWLLVTSLYFYMCWGIGNLLIMVICTLTVYACGLALEAFTDRESVKKWILLIGVAGLLCVLFFYKYINFALHNIDLLMHWMNIQMSMPAFNMILPVGISFYVFQMIAYLTDVYRGKINAERNLLKFCLFIAFFPKVEAGPIVKAKDFFAQLSEEHPFDEVKVQSGFMVILLGMFEKIVIADSLLPVVTSIWENYATMNSLYLWIAAFAYAIYIYCDFGGYSHIAIGAAQVLGYDIPTNFIQPYFATDIREFWHRWHVSLSEWLKDYIYIPMGGNRHGNVRKYINIFLVFLFSGLWHGAGWHFVLWGALHGIYQILEGVFSEISLKRTGNKKTRKNSPIRTGILRIKTFVLVSVAWILFYCPSLTDGLHFIKGMIFQWNVDMRLSGTAQLGIMPSQLYCLMFGLVILFLIDSFREKGRALGKWLCKKTIAIRWSVCMVMCLYILLAAFQRFGQEAAGFVYFQF